ncbi:MAG: hypothetical protein M3245_02485, partial [Actinomycetota bacterium]|nr:hypothetical protein [Actinomycetota bacterium]
MPARMRPRLPALTAIVLALAVAAPASATQHEPWQPNLRTERTYFHCAGDPTMKVDNLRNDRRGTVIPWNATAPTASWTAGAGCGTIEPALPVSSNLWGDPLVNATFEGDFEANLDTLTLHVHNVHLDAQTRAGFRPLRFFVQLFVDGLKAWDGRNPENAVDVHPVPSA